MGRVDMPLEELKEYKGINPRPDDFDAYWDRALAEMRAVEPQVERIPSDFQVPFADCFDLYFTGVRGARIHAKYVRPKNVVEPHPAVVQFHGYSGSAGEWHDKLGYAALGYSNIFMDVRGQGGSSEDTGGVKGNTQNGHIIRGLDDHEDQLFFRHVFLDAAQLAGIVMQLPEVDPNQVYAAGGSQGGALTIACGALEPRVKKLSILFPFLSDYKRIYDLNMAHGSYGELLSFFRQFDPQHKREDEIFTRLGYIDVQNLAHRIQGEVLFGIGMMDTTCAPSTQFAVYNKITARKRMEIYPDHGHEGIPGFNDTTLQFFLEE